MALPHLHIAIICYRIGTCTHYEFVVSRVYTSSRGKHRLLFKFALDILQLFIYTLLFQEWKENLDCQLYLIVQK